MKATTKRIAWIDIARGIGIVLVVYGHVLRGLASAHFLSTRNPVWASDYTIYTFHMPLFFLLAGLQVDQSLAKGAGRFLSSKVRTIAYPYVLWSLFQGALQLLMPGILNSPRSPWTLVTILWRPIAQFWFLYVLFLCHVMAFLAGARRSLLVPLLVVCFVCAVLAMHGAPNGLVLLAALPHWFMFYSVGILLSRSLLAWQPRVGAALFWAAASVVGLGVFSHLGRAFSHTNPDAPASWPASIAGIALIICISHLVVQSREMLASRIEVLGRASLTVYIFHVLAAAGTRVVLNKLHVTEWEPQLILGTLVGVGAPLLLHQWLERTNMLAPLGLGARRKKPHPKAEQLANTLGLS